jgi:hypothetical protein
LHYQCKVCATGVNIDPSRTNASLARELGVSKDSVRRHKAHMGKEVDQFFVDIPVSAISQRRSVIRLPDGSYERVTWNPNRAEFLQALSYDDIERAIEGYKPSQAPKTPHGAPARMAYLADWQLGKTDVNGGSQETVAKVQRAYDTLEALIKATPVSELVLADLGDIIENFQNTRSQAQTNDLDLTCQVRGARRLLLEGIMRLAPLVPVLTLVSVPSNHCQVRAEGSKDLAAEVDNDWGLELHEQIKDVLSDRKEFSNVRFVRPAKFDEAVTHTAGGAVVGFAHGHQAGKADRVADWWKGQSHGRRSNLHNADYLVHGHFHNFRLSQSGDERWLIGTPSADPGSAWYARHSGESSTSGTLTHLLRDGQWEDMRIV